jgi:hypothetical protein
VVKTLIISPRKKGVGERDNHVFHGLNIKSFDNQTVSLP